MKRNLYLTTAPQSYSGAGAKKNNKQFKCKAAAALMAIMMGGMGLFSGVAQAQVTASTPVQRQMEKLDRGLIAINQGNGKVYVGWRLLNTDAANVAFNLYRKTGTDDPIKINGKPITTSTNWVDEGVDLSQSNAYFVRPVLNSGPDSGEEQADAQSKAFVLPANAAAKQYFSIQLDRPAEGIMPQNGQPYSYSPNDCSTADLDGDGELEIILKWEPSNSKDNSQSGYTANVLLDAYKMNGTRLWRIDLGKNIRAGAHYTQFMAYDLDGDGKAEVACKTADGTVDGQGKVIGDAEVDHRNTAGYILKGPEFMTVFNGETGVAMATTSYVPSRHPTIENPTPDQIRQVWGDNYGNRIDRFLAGVAYLDGQTPSLIMCRGYYTRAVVVAWDFKNNELSQRWIFDTEDGTPGNTDYRGQGAHSLAIGDVDGDGKDEIVYGAATIDDNGKGLYSTKLGHGDALHLSDMDPTRPGLEYFMVHETQSQYGSSPLSLIDAKTGEIIWGRPGPNQGDVGRGVAMDIDPRYLGYEAWGSRGGLYSAKGELISNAKPGQMNFAVWWDGDLHRELLDRTMIDKWDHLNNKTNRLLTAYLEGAEQNNGTKANPSLSADLFGDWREEVIWRHNNNEELLVFTTTIPTNYRFTTLLQDPTYRLSVAWQNVGYNQPPHPGFYLGEGMTREQLIAAGHNFGMGNKGGITNLAVFPNPFSGAFQIAATGAFTYTILDNVGNAVETGTGVDRATAGGSLNKGIYFVKVETAEASEVTRVVKE